VVSAFKYTNVISVYICYNRNVLFLVNYGHIQRATNNNCSHPT